MKRRIPSWRSVRVGVRCMRKGHAYQHFMDAPYERCRRCGRVPTTAAVDDATGDPVLPFRYQAMVDAARGEHGRSEAAHGP